MHSSDRKKSNSILTRSVRKKKKISDSITVEKEISNVDCEASISNSMDIDENLFAEESLNFDSKNKYFLKERIIKKKQLQIIIRIRNEKRRLKCFQTKTICL